MMAQSSGDTALTRTTLEKIIKEALPMSSIRVQKDAIDLICHLANCFIDLISDVANNVCSMQKRCLMGPEHLLRAVQEIHLDEYLLYCLNEE